MAHPAVNARTERNRETVAAVTEALAAAGCDHDPLVEAWYNIDNLCEELVIEHDGDTHRYYVEARDSFEMMVKRFVLPNLGHG